MSDSRVSSSLVLVLACASSACSPSCGEEHRSTAQQVSIPVRTGREPASAETAPPATSESPPTGTPTAAVPREAGVRHDAGTTIDLTPYATATLLSGKPIGHTSVVLKLKLEGGLTAAFKPSAGRGPLRYKGEIAAYRLAKALGLTNVPPAIPRTFPLTALATTFGAKETDGGAAPAKELLLDAHGDVKGALIPWIPNLGFMAIESEPLLSEWKRWLGGSAAVPDDKVALASQISTLIAFDYVTANWDRWSGGNVGYDAASGTLLYIDNDAAFFDVPPAGLVMIQKARLDGVGRFSKSFVEHLRKLDVTALTQAMGEDSDGSPLLGPKAFDGVIARREAALKAIDARIAKAGAEAALPFE